MFQEALPTPSPVTSSNLEVVKAWGPIVVGFGAIVASFITSLFVLRTQQKQNRAQNEVALSQLDLQKRRDEAQNEANARQFNLAKSKEERDEITKKLNSFYGPFKELRTQSKILYGKFALRAASDYEAATGTRFRTLRYLLEGKTFDAQDTEILTQILQIGQEQLKLIESQMGLVDKPELQDLLGMLAAHIRILQLAFDKKLTGPPDAFDDVLFPLAIDGAIESAVLRLQDRLKELNEFQSGALPTKRDSVPENSTIRYYDLNADAYANKTSFIDCRISTNVSRNTFLGVPGSLTRVAVRDVMLGTLLSAATS
jgi:hypothetical protein